MQLDGLTSSNQEIQAILQSIGEFIPLNDENPHDCYLLREREAMAVIAALASNRSLIVRGEPGCGKTELAAGIARLIDRCLVATTIQPDTDSADLLWSIDHTQRLADAQATKLSTDIKTYLCAGPVWWAIEPETAKGMRGQAGYHPKPDSSTTEVDKRNTVLLIDEIDKGTGAQVADGLLEVMGKGGFAVPPLGDSIGTHENRRSPLIIFTSNKTRDLPAAFLRRCVVLDCELPEDPTNLFCEIGAKRFPQVEKQARIEASNQITADRNASNGSPQAGLAEYLDLLRALTELAPGDEVAQLEWLDQIAQCFKKSTHPTQ